MAWDDDLFAYYLEDFEGWTKEMFSKVERITLRSLKSVLRHRGVYTGKNHAKITDSFLKILKMENLPEWDPAEFQAMEFDNRSKAYKRQQNAQRTVPTTRQQSLQPNPPAGEQEPQSQQQSQDVQPEEPHEVRQGIQSRSQTLEPHPVYQTMESRTQTYQNTEGQQPPYISGALEEPQSRQQEEQDAGQADFEERTPEEITKFHDHSQLNGSARCHFKINLKDDCHFNYEILVEEMYLGNKPTLHVADYSTAFQGAKFLSAISAKETWQVLLMPWVDTYQGPTDILTHDAGTDFMSAELHAEAKFLGVTCKQLPTKAHCSMGKTDRYDAPMRHAWDTIHAERVARLFKRRRKPCAISPQSPRSQVL
jgi:hypothetical protein